MSKSKKAQLRYIALYVLFVTFFIVVLPLCCTSIFSSPDKVEDIPQYNISIPDTVDVYITKKKRYKSIKFETYIEGVVASEMPSSFDLEALKAQAVASRTYALGRILSGAELCDTEHCQVYRSKNIPAKTRHAVLETQGQILLYDGELATQALYFSSSAGDTENAEDVFANPYPYLVSVSSSDEPGATHKKEVTTMTLSAFRKKIKRAFPDLDFGTIKRSNIKILSHTKGGRVNTVQIGNQTLSGSDMRTALSLYSTRFTLKLKGNTLTITSSGFGHGVGMSQYGANGLAKKGKTYREILSHYYQGIHIGHGD